MKQQKIIHIDMDCFYAAIEERDNPNLNNKPLAVGGSAKRGVISTCNYPARKYGIHSAMPTARALKLCPELIIVAPNFAKYKVASQVIRKIFSQYTNLVEPLSFDEAYLDVSNCSQHQGSATRIAQAIRREILSNTNLTASAGVAPNKFLAKVASDWRKPNGIFVITPTQVAKFVLSLPVNKIFGVGKVTAKKLTNLGIQTCGDMQKLTLQDLVNKFGCFGANLYQLCRGIDHREVKSDRVRKSLSVETTFSSDLLTLEDCLSEISKLYDELLVRLQKIPNKNISKQFIKIKFSDFRTTTVECCVTSLSLDDFKQLLVSGMKRRNKPIRLLGLGVRFNEDKVITAMKQLKLIDSN